jgi:hypothetical protein
VESAGRTTANSTRDDISPLCHVNHVLTGRVFAITSAAPLVADGSGWNVRLKRLMRLKGRNRVVGPAASSNRDATLPFVIPRVCNFIGFEKKLMLKTKGLGASKVGKNQ